MFLLFSCADSQVTHNLALSVPGIPKNVPQLPHWAKFSPDNFKECVFVDYKDDSVFVSDLPQGVRMVVKGADVVMQSMAKNVEYRLSGATRNGSFQLSSNEQALVSLSSLKLFSYKRNAITLSSPRGMFIRSVGNEVSYIMDGIPGDSVYVPKNSAAVFIEGNAVLCGGNIALRGERSVALGCKGRLFFDGTDISVEHSRTDGISADSGVAVLRGNMRVIAQKDAIKAKKGDVVVVNGNLTLKTVADKGDAVQARNFYQYSGNIIADVRGAASRGVNSKGAVYLMDGMLNVKAAGNAVFSPKKNDYTSGACVKSETHLYIGRAYVSLENSGDGGKGVNCNGMMQIDGGALRVNVFGNDVQHPEDYTAHTSAKGVKCDSAVLIKGGLIEIAVFGKGARCEGFESKRDMIIDGENTIMYVYANDDAINASGDIIINNGRIYAYSVANDAIDGNARIELNGGVVLANGGESPEQGVDVDVDSRFVITGGTLVSIGGKMGAHQALPRGKGTSQPVFVWNIGELSRGKYVNLADESGHLLYSYCLPRTIHDGSLLISSQLFEHDKNYMFSISDTIGNATHIGNGLYINGTVNVDSAFVVQSGGVVTVLRGDGTVDALPVDTAFAGGFPAPPPGFDGTRGFPAPHGLNSNGASRANKNNEGYSISDLPGGGWVN